MDTSPNRRIPWDAWFLALAFVVFAWPSRGWWLAWTFFLCAAVLLWLPVGARSDKVIRGLAVGLALIALAEACFSYVSVIENSGDDSQLLALMWRYLFVATIGIGVSLWKFRPGRDVC